MRQRRFRWPHRPLPSPIPNVLFFNWDRADLTGRTRQTIAEAADSTVSQTMSQDTYDQYGACGNRSTMRHINFATHLSDSDERLLLKEVWTT